MFSRGPKEYLEGQVGDVYELVVSDGQHVEETKLGEGSRLDLLHAVVVQLELFQGGEAIKGLLQYQERSGSKGMWP